jgi:hypothetical protein
MSSKTSPFLQEANVLEWTSSRATNRFSRCPTSPQPVCSLLGVVCRPLRSYLGVGVGSNLKTAYIYKTPRCRDWRRCLLRYYSTSCLSQRVRAIHRPHGPTQSTASRQQASTFTLSSKNTHVVSSNNMLVLRPQNLRKRSLVVASGWQRHANCARKTANGGRLFTQT